MTVKKIAIIAAVVVALIAAINLLERAFRKQGPSTELAQKRKDLAALQSFMTGQETPEMDSDDSALEEALKGSKKKEFIKDVFFEKTEVCLNESLEIRAELENPDGPLSDLICRIGGAFGDKAIVHFDEPGEENITVIARDLHGNIDTRKLKFNVIECPGKASIVLRSARSRTRMDEAEIAVVQKKGVECPCTYEWDFGDGTNLATAEEKVIHHYGKREQTAFSSTFIVTVNVIGNKNIRASGRTSITFPNIQWASKQMGYSIVPITQDQVRGLTEGKNEITVKIQNIYDNSIVFDTAAIHAKNCGDDDRVYSETVKANTLLNKTEIRGGETAEAILAIPKSAVPDSACGVTILLRGHFPDNALAVGMVFVLRK